jgi:hypothetical protein
VKEVLKEKFLVDFAPAERILFLRKAKEAIERKGYPAGEDLFHYCYFLTLGERIRGIGATRGEGYVRILLAEGTREIEEMITLYQDRLEKSKTVPPDPVALRFIEFLFG